MLTAIGAAARSGNVGAWMVRILVVFSEVVLVGAAIIILAIGVQIATRDRNE